MHVSVVQMDPQSTQMVPPPTTEDLTIKIVCGTAQGVKPVAQITWIYRGNTAMGNADNQCDEYDSEYCFVKSKLEIRSLVP